MKLYVKKQVRNGILEKNAEHYYQYVQMRFLVK